MTGVVQTASGGITFTNSSSYSGSVAFGSNVTAGNSVVVGVTFRDTNNVAPSSYTVSVTDGTNTYTQQASYNLFMGVSRNAVSYIYTAPIASSGALTVSVAVTGGVAGKGGAIFILEVAGLSSRVPTATGTGGLTSGGGHIDTTSVSWSAADVLLFAVLQGIDS